MLIYDAIPLLPRLGLYFEINCLAGAWQKYGLHIEEVGISPAATTLIVIGRSVSLQKKLASTLNKYGRVV